MTLNLLNIIEFNVFRSATIELVSLDSSLACHFSEFLIGHSLSVWRLSPIDIGSLSVEWRFGLRGAHSSVNVD